MGKEYFVYIMANKKEGTIYIGSTSNLKERIAKHKLKLVEGFSKKYNTTMLVYFEESGSPEAMISRERQLKHWGRDWKVKLVSEFNPEWRDLASEEF